MNYVISPIDVVSELGLTLKKLLLENEGDVLAKDITDLFVGDISILTYVADFTDPEEQYKLKIHVQKNLLDVLVCMVLDKVINQLGENGYYSLMESILKHKFAFEFNCRSVHFDMFASEDITDLLEPETILQISTTLNSYLETLFRDKDNYVSLTASLLQTLSCLESLTEVNCSDILNVTISDGCVIFITRE